MTCSGRKPARRGLPRVIVTGVRKGGGDAGKLKAQRI